MAFCPVCDNDTFVEGLIGTTEWGQDYCYDDCYHCGYHEEYDCEEDFEFYDEPSDDQAAQDEV